MNPETEGTKSPLDTPLLVLAVLIVAAAIGAFSYFDQLNLGLRWLLMLVGAGAAVGLAYMTAQGKSLAAFVRGSNIELRRVVWPTRKEATQTTLLIVLVVMILAGALWGVDAVLLWAVRTLTGREV